MGVVFICKGCRRTVAMVLQDCAVYRDYTLKAARPYTPPGSATSLRAKVELLRRRVKVCPMCGRRLEWRQPEILVYALDKRVAL